MKTIYVVTSNYMSLIAKEDFLNPSERAMSNRRILHTQDITNKMIEETFANSKNNLLAFNTKEEAVITMALGLKGNDTTPEYIDGDIPCFAVPIVFTAEIEDDYSLEEAKSINGTMLYNYFETQSIPLFSAKSEQGLWKDSTITMIDKQINTLESCPQAFIINKTALCNKIEAFYLAVNPVREANVRLANATEDLKKIRDQEAAPLRPACSIM